MDTVLIVFIISATVIFVADQWRQVQIARLDHDARERAMNRDKINEA